MIGERTTSSGDGGREGSATVLVIDDEYGARLQVEVALMTSERLEVVGTATNGSHGAELAERLQPDIVILDLSMPVMDGLEALPLLRTVAPGATILIRSNRDDDASRESAMRLGASAFIPKFLAPDDLRSIVERAARGAVSPRLVEAVRRAACSASVRPARGGGRQRAVVGEGSSGFRRVGSGAGIE